MRFTLNHESHPKISMTCKTYIETHLSPTLWNEDEKVFSLAYILDDLIDVIANNEGEDYLGITNLDIKVLTELLDEDVDYITIQLN